MQKNSSLQLTSLASYLAARQEVIQAREGFFHAVRAYLRPEQRIDAELLGDWTSRASCRTIGDDEWVANPARGYITVLESSAKARFFRLSVLQLGETLRVGIRIPGNRVISDEAESRLMALFTDTACIKVKLISNINVQFEWQFSANAIYTNVQAYENAVYRISAVFETALHVFADGA